MTANQRAANGLLASLEDQKTAFSFKPEDAPFVFAFDTKKDFFGWLMEPENSQALHDVGSGVNWLNVCWYPERANFRARPSTA
jgi:hypothetical protein